VISFAWSRQRPMFDSPDQDNSTQAGEPLQISALFGFAALISSDPGDASATGTIDTSIEAVERSFYGEGSENLITGVPVGVKALESPRARLRAKDLIAELNMINQQIHRIMFQVDRAVSRLGTSG
jgi:hypothetical protein